MQDEKKMTFESDVAMHTASAAENLDASHHEPSNSELGKFPSRLNGVSAEILARLLNGERLTGIDAVDSASTTRLASRIHYLKECGWPIKKKEKAAGCRDGRLAWVAEYHMPDEIIARAKPAGAATWCASVKAARRNLRAKAAQAKQEANRVNALGKGNFHSQQLGLSTEVSA